MILSILIISMVAVGVTLCVVLAEPWQRGRYDQLVDALEARWSDELDHEARES